MLGPACAAVRKKTFDRTLWIDAKHSQSFKFGERMDNCLRERAAVSMFISTLIKGNLLVRLGWRVPSGTREQMDGQR